MKFSTENLRKLCSELSEQFFDFWKTEDKERLELNRKVKKWKRQSKSLLKTIDGTGFDWSNFLSRQQNSQLGFKTTELETSFGICYQENLGQDGMEFSGLFNRATLNEITPDCIVRYFVHDDIQDGNDTTIITSPDDSKLIAALIHSD